MRIKSKWGKGKEHNERSIEDQASAVAFIVWRIAQDALLNLENDDYQTDSLKQRMDVVVEFVIFLTHLADRYSYENMSAAEREQFVVGIVMNLARNYQGSMEDIEGIQEHKKDFIDLVNERMADYSEMPFDGEDPSFMMRRYLGSRVQQVMGERHNKWIETQVLEINAPEAIDNLKRAMENLLKPGF